jgi:hypothetical protein
VSFWITIAGGFILDYFLIIRRINVFEFENIDLC